MTQKRRFPHSRRHFTKQFKIHRKISLLSSLPYAKKKNERNTKLHSLLHYLLCNLTLKTQAEENGKQQQTENLQVFISAIAVDKQNLRYFSVVLLSCVF